MAKKSIRVEISPDEKIQISYDGYVGNACYAEAEKLRLAFSGIGLDVETKQTTDTKTEVEVRRLENQQGVGA